MPGALWAIYRVAGGVSESVRTELPRPVPCASAELSDGSAQGTIKHRAAVSQSAKQVQDAGPSSERASKEPGEQARATRGLQRDGAPGLRPVAACPLA